MRVVLGFALAPLAPLLIAAPLAFAFGRLEILGPLAFMCVFFGYPLALVLALPWYVQARRLRPPSLRLVLGAGLAIGAAVPAFLILCMKLLSAIESLSEPGAAPAEGWRFLLGWAQVSLVGGGIGVSSAFCFWLIALRGQPVVAVAKVRARL